MNRSYIEEFTGQNVIITMINESTYEGILWFVRFEDKTEENVYSICLDSHDFEFEAKYIKDIVINKN